MLDLLSELAVKYGSDKWSAKHSYTAWYYAQFAARRETVRKVVEIGVGEGASLRMWREFFPNAMIIGFDNDPARIFTDERIRVIQGDQSKFSDLQSLIWEMEWDVDLFIDDGSHDLIDQLYTAQVVKPSLPLATYVIEDVALTIPIDAVRLGGLKFYEPVLEHRNRYDNRLVVIHA